MFFKMQPLKYVRFAIQHFRNNGEKKKEYSLIPIPDAESCRHRTVSDNKIDQQKIVIPFSKCTHKTQKDHIYVHAVQKHYTKCVANQSLHKIYMEKEHTLQQMCTLTYFLLFSFLLFFCLKFFAVLIVFTIAAALCNRIVTSASIRFD